jgi:hypothetical protein
MTLADALHEHVNTKFSGATISCRFRRPRSRRERSHIIFEETTKKKSVMQGGAGSCREKVGVGFESRYAEKMARGVGQTLNCDLPLSSHFQTRLQRH